jgi:phosphatidyl-myo-inositol dimannoside synthase
MIVITTQCFPPRPGGIEHLMHACASALAAKGIAVTVLADHNDSPLTTAFDHTQTFPIHRFRGFKPWRRWRKARALAELIATRQCTGVIADSWKSLEHFRPAQRVPTLCLAHGTELPLTPTHHKARRISAAFARASAIIANSSFTAARAARYVTASALIQVIHPGLTVAEPSSDELATQFDQTLAGATPRLISVGRLEPRKGIDRVLRVLPRLIAQFPRLVYLVIGDGSIRQALETQARALALLDHVRFIHGASDQVRDAYLAVSDLFVLPGRINGDDVEGFGMAYIEAAWFGLSAVAGNAGGAVEAVLHEQTGLVCQGDQDEDLYLVIKRLLDNPAWRRELGARAQTRAYEFLWDKVVDKYLSLLK